MSTVKSKKLQVGTDASASNNFTIYQPSTPDGTLRIGVGNADSPTEVAQFTSAGLVSGVSKLDTATGSAPSYSARAWVNFNGTGTVAIRESGNVSSITDNGAGNYDVNFTTAMPDVNYCVVVTGAENVPMSSARDVYTQGAAETTSIANVNAYRAAQYDLAYMSVAIFR